jgi:hypothetical protein
MLLSHIFEDVSSIDTQIAAASKAKAAIKAKMQMSPALAQTHKAAFDKASAALTALVQKNLRAEGEKASKASLEHKKALNKAEESKPAQQKAAEKKERFGKAVSQGLKDNKEKREEAGGSAGQAASWLNYVRDSSRGGEKVTGADIAQHFGINTRTVNKRLEMPEYKAVRSALGR